MHSIKSHKTDWMLILTWEMLTFSIFLTLKITPCIEWKKWLTAKINKEKKTQKTMYSFWHNFKRTILFINVMIFWHAKRSFIHVMIYFEYKTHSVLIFPFHSLAWMFPMFYFYLTEFTYHVKNFAFAWNTRGHPLKCITPSMRKDFEKKSHETKEPF